MRTEEVAMPDTGSLEQSKYAVTDIPVEDIMLRRWSPRAFADKPVSEGDLRSIFEAASWAASSYNEQPWRFLVGRKGDDTYGKIFDALLPLNQGWAGAAPVLYASFMKKSFTHNAAPNGVAMHDVGAASANASLQATSLGLHTHGMAGFSKDKLREAFAVPESFDPVACWALGYAGDPQTLPENFRDMELKPRVRKPLGEIVFRSWEKPAL